VKQRHQIKAPQTSMFIRQQLETATENRCFQCGVCRNVIRRTVSESRLTVDSRQFEQLLGLRQSPAGNVSTEAEDIVTIRHYVATGEDMAN
jgi:hypothetical protein